MSTNTTDSIEDELKTILVDELFCDVPIEEIQSEDGLHDVLGLDSLGFVELRAQCEQRFAVEVADVSFTPEHFRTLRTVAALVRSLRGTSRG